MALSTHTDVFPILADLANLFPVSDLEQAALAQLPMQIRDVEAGVDIVGEGERPSRCCALFDGFACTYRIGTDGRRRITAFHLPGDMPDLRSLHLGVPGGSNEGVLRVGDERVLASDPDEELGQPWLGRYSRHRIEAWPVS